MNVWSIKRNKNAGLNEKNLYNLPKLSFHSHHLILRKPFKIYKMRKYKKVTLSLSVDSVSDSLASDSDSLASAWESLASISAFKINTIIHKMFVKKKLLK